MKRIISILIENKPGALARVVGLFHQRGYNIETLNVGPVFDGTYSRMSVTTRGSENDVEQITKQINKIIDVIKVSDLTEGDHHEYESGHDRFSPGIFEFRSECVISEAIQGQYGN